jgi:AraC-like DNA-binding protein
MRCVAGCRSLPISAPVGYVSPSQFSREYSRFFGSAPIKDIARLREEGFAPPDGAD